MVVCSTPIYLLFKFFQIVFRKNFVLQIPQFHFRIFQSGFLALAQSVFHDKAGWALLGQYCLEALVTSSLKKPVGEVVELGAVGPEIRFPYPM